MSSERTLFGGITTLLGGIGIGAGMMYVLDPDRGARRRSLVRDKAAHALHQEKDMFEKGSRDLENRTYGLFARIRSALEPDDVSDEKLVARVRSIMGRHVTHPSSIEVAARDGHITLSGPVFKDEVDDLVSTVLRVRGVRDVRNQLDAHESAEGVPGLQGEARQPPRSALLRETWPPSLQLVIGTAALTTTLYGFKRRGIAGNVLAGLGALTLTRALANKPIRRFVGLGAGRRGVVQQKTITVHAPLHEVFEFFDRFENFPRFMEHVREVNVQEDRTRSRWKLEGPGGTSVSWNAERTRHEPDKLIAWRSMPGSRVDHAGVLRFEPVDEGRTRVDVRMTYHPPAGMAGHLVAKLFHTDPKRCMDDDLMRVKNLFEGRGVPGEAREPGISPAPEVEAERPSPDVH